MKCEVTTYGKPCTSGAYCLYRKRVYEAGSWVYKHMYVCETHSKNHDRTNDTYNNLLIDSKGQLGNYSGEDSPYWQYYQRSGLDKEAPRANPDEIGDDSISPWRSEVLDEYNEELIKKVKDNMKLLSFREGQILNLMCYKNMSQAQIASFLNIKPQAVSMYLKRIRKKMQKFV